MASLMSLYQQGHALQQERKTAAPPTAQSASYLVSDFGAQAAWKLRFEKI
jgi:hypothetical protein